MNEATTFRRDSQKLSTLTCYVLGVGGVLGLFCFVLFGLFGNSPRWRFLAILLRLAFLRPMVVF